MQEKAKKTADEEVKARKKAQEAKIKADQEEDKERATILRKCPNCGSFIPHLSNICPDCGFIIQSNETDKKIGTIITLFRTCIENLVYDDYDSTFWVNADYTKIKKEQYDEFPNCYKIEEEGEKDYLKVSYVIEGILSEAELYKDNVTVNNLFIEFRNKKRYYLLKDFKEYIEVLNNILNPNKNNFGNEELYQRRYDETKWTIDRFKNNYTDLFNQEEYSAMDNELLAIDVKHEEVSKQPLYKESSDKIVREKEEREKAYREQKEREQKEREKEEREKGEREKANVIIGNRVSPLFSSMSSFVENLSFKIILKLVLLLILIWWVASCAMSMILW